jgi:hypothetical protein
MLIRAPIEALSVELSFMGNSQNFSLFTAWIQGKWCMWVTNTIEAFSLEDAPQRVDEFFASGGVLTAIEIDHK